ncbi:MAG: hypothetical protein CFE31_19210 [Rhizobiales bacterium PAR1]|nr:MAG: hypothetical protein CFE31_19210 [Rhizobiales bacterium PAR1]
MPNDRQTDVFYTHRAKPYSSEIVLRLGRQLLEVEKGKSKQSYPLDKLERIRLSYAPRNVSRLTFVCEIRARDGHSVTINNLDWKSLIQVEKVDPAYRAFVQTLVTRTAALNPNIQLAAGCGMIRYRLTQAVGFGVTAALIVAAFYYGGLIGDFKAAEGEANQHAGRLLAGGSVALAIYLGLWLKTFLTRNRLRSFAAQAIPESVLPTG